MGTSRIAAPTSRPGSRARDILKRRDRPHQSELVKALDRKRRQQIHTSYSAPAGFTFLPLGTPDLAERCQELSRQRQLPIHVVNAKPFSKHGADPTSVSHHTSRIGYHFNAGIVDEACQQLGYVLYHGQFVKESDLQAQYTQSRIAQTMAKHGLKADQPKTQETPEQVRAAIKELFPKIPELDLDSIVTHAWAEGTDRVGTVSDLPLSRRVQLATIARIRHQYTDYDSLLKAFGDWKSARETVEPECLRKLIEWRGEIDLGDDEELHEIVRETIVIPDDDEEEYRGARGKRSPADHGNTSDASIEVTHQVARDEDLGAESTDERYRYDGVRRRHWNPRQMEDWNNIARQKIGDMRRQLREAPPTAFSVSVQPNARGELPTAIVVDGQVFERVSTSNATLHGSVAHQPQAPPDPRPLMNGPILQPPFNGHQPTMAPLHEQPMASIERNDFRQDIPRQPSPMSSGNYIAQNYRNGTEYGLPGPPVDHADKRRRVDYPPQENRAPVPSYEQRHAPDPKYNALAAYPHSRPEQQIGQAGFNAPQPTNGHAYHFDRPGNSTHGNFIDQPFQPNRAAPHASHWPSSGPQVGHTISTATNSQSYRPETQQYEPNGLSTHSGNHHIHRQAPHQDRPTFYAPPEYSRGPPPQPRIYGVPPQDDSSQRNEARPLYSNDPQHHIIPARAEENRRPPPSQPIYGAPAPPQHAGSGTQAFPSRNDEPWSYYERPPPPNPPQGTSRPAPYHNYR